VIEGLKRHFVFYVFIVYVLLLMTYKPSISGNQSRKRAQSTPQIVVGGVVVLLISGPLLGATIDLQQGLASTPAFSNLFAGLIALLFLLAIVFGLLGIE